MQSTSESQGWLLLWNCENLSTSLVVSKKNLVLEVVDKMQKTKGSFSQKKITNLDANRRLQYVLNALYVSENPSSNISS
jgi:hypothetical protein